MPIRTPHVLIVDDSRVHLFVASTILISSNIRVTVAEGPMQALEFLDVNTDDVDLILTDYCMPHISGYDLLREVKESPRLNHIPVVITCTDVNPERIIECFAEGAEDYIVKPLRAADVPRLLSYM